MGFQKEFIELMKKYDVEIGVDMDHDYQGSIVNSIDISYEDCGATVGLSLYGKGPYFEVNAKMVSDQLTPHMDKDSL